MIRDLPPLAQWRHVVTCPVCGGDGTVELPLSEDPADSRDYRCPICEGIGRVWVLVYEIEGLPGRRLTWEVEGPAYEEVEHA